MQLKYGYLIYKSITFAQGAQRGLHAFGFRAAVSRAPKQLSADGCAYVVRIDGASMVEALKTVKDQQRVPISAFRGDGSGSFEPYTL